jgi:hypothetical protein
MRPPEAAGGGADFVLAPPGDGTKLGEPLVLDAVMPTGIIGRTEQFLTSRVPPKSRERVRCPVPTSLKVDCEGWISSLSPRG